MGLMSLQPRWLLLAALAAVVVGIGLAISVFAAIAG
jgi:hypothetical protein